MLRRTGSEPLYRQVSRTLEVDIVSGVLGPDDRLPPESELAEQFSVNRLTVRQALAQLARRGLVYAVQGKGTFVAPPPIRYDVSASNEASLSRAMRELGHTSRQHLLRSTRDPDREVAGELGTRGAVRRYDLLRVVDEVPWSLTRTWVAERRFRRLPEQWDGARSLYETLEREYGVAMRRAYRTFTAVPADEVDAEHLLLPLGAPVLQQRGLNVDAEGRPVAVVEHRLRGDRAQITVELS